MPPGGHPATMDATWRACHRRPAAAPRRMGLLRGKCAGADAAFFLDRINSAFAGLVDGLCDPARRRRVAFGLVAGYAAAWAIYGIVAKSSQDVNADMAEMVVWAREPALGYPKHPPLLAFVLGSGSPYFRWPIGPTAACRRHAFGRTFIWHSSSSAIWLDGEKRAAVPFLLAVIPFYNFLGLKFDQNSALIPLWALAMWALLRSLDTRRTGWAALAGRGGGGGHDDEILVGLSARCYWRLTALSPIAGATAYFRSAAPWVTALVFILVVLAPRRLAGLRTLSAAHLGRGAAERDFAGDILAFDCRFIPAARPAMRRCRLCLCCSSSSATRAVRDGWVPREPPRRSRDPVLDSAAAADPGGRHDTSVCCRYGIRRRSICFPSMLLGSELYRREPDRGSAHCRCHHRNHADCRCGLAACRATILKSGVENNAAYARLVMQTRHSGNGAIPPTSRSACSPGSFALASAAAFYIADRPSTYARFFASICRPGSMMRASRARAWRSSATADDDSACDACIDCSLRGTAGRPRTEVTVRATGSGSPARPRISSSLPHVHDRRR